MLREALRSNRPAVGDLASVEFRLRLTPDGQPATWPSISLLGFRYWRLAQLGNGNATTGYFATNVGGVVAPEV